jgi:hypothetical protein
MLTPLSPSLLEQICMHFFTTAFLVQAAAALEQSRNYHVAFKSIPSVKGPTQGCKLEQFIFDVFPLAGQKVALLEVSCALTWGDC